MPWFLPESRLPTDVTETVERFGEIRGPQYSSAEDWVQGFAKVLSTPCYEFKPPCTTEPVRGQHGLRKETLSQNKT